MELVSNVAKYIINYRAEIDKPISNLQLQYLLALLEVKYYNKFSKSFYCNTQNMFLMKDGVPKFPEIYDTYCSYGGLGINTTILENIQLNVLDTLFIIKFLEETKDKTTSELANELKDVI